MTVQPAQQKNETEKVAGMTQEKEVGVESMAKNQTIEEARILDHKYLQEIESKLDLLKGVVNINTQQ